MKRMKYLKLNGIIERNILTKSTVCGTSRLNMDVHSLLILQLIGIKLGVTDQVVLDIKGDAKKN